MSKNAFTRIRRPFVVVLLACTTLVTVMPANAACLADSGVPPWKIAVVFKKQDGTRVFAGVITEAELRSVAASGRANGSAPAKGAYEIWFADNGTTRGVTYNQSTRLWSELSSVRAPRTYHQDGGAVANIIALAHDPPGQRPRHIDAVARASWPPPSPTLRTMCKGAHTIAVGQIVGILREAHTPIGAPYDEQHTVFVMAVEQYLKTGNPAQPPIIKIHNEGGTLPFVEPTGRNAGRSGAEVDDDPLLDVGLRYLLFLRSLDEAIGPNHTRGYVSAEIGGYSGKEAELDEYKAIDHWRGKLLLIGGYTRPPRAMGHPHYDSWRFDKDPQILNVPEAVALHAIRDSLTAIQAGKDP
jgi:hypothetical protein